ncbi:endoribonuclease Dicer [Sarracenia purpurea var. burkii]
MEATVIGYNEAPIDVTSPDAIPFEHLKLQEPSRNQCNPKMHSISEKPKKVFSTGIRSIRLPQPSLVAQQPQSPASIGNNLLGGGSCKKSARSHLYEICAINSWKPPFFECCKETGPSHSKE